MPLTLEEIQTIIADEFFGYGYEVTKSAIEDLENYIPRIRQDIAKQYKKMFALPNYNATDSNGVRLISQQEIDIRHKIKNLKYHLNEEIEECRRCYKELANTRAKAQRKTFKLVMSQKLKEIEA